MVEQLPNWKVLDWKKENILEWKRLTETNNIWEYEENLDHQGLIETFLHSQKPGKEKGGAKRSLSDSEYDKNKSKEKRKAAGNDTWPGVIKGHCQRQQGALLFSKRWKDPEVDKLSHPKKQMGNVFQL